MIYCTVYAGLWNCCKTSIANLQCRISYFESKAIQAIHYLILEEVEIQKISTVEIISKSTHLFTGHA